MEIHGSYNRIMSVLCSRHEPLTKDTIARQTGLQIGTVAARLTRMRRVNLVDSTYGRWFPTEFGRSFHKSSPNGITEFYMSQLDRSENWQQELIKFIGPDKISTSAIYQWAKKAKNDPERYNYEEVFWHIVVAWMTLTGNDPNIDVEIDIEKKLPPIQDYLGYKFINPLRDFLGEQEEEEEEEPPVNPNNFGIGLDLQKQN